MKQKYLKIGKIVGSHGIKGMVRVECWCDSPDFLCKFKRLFTAENNDSELKIEKASAQATQAPAPAPMPTFEPQAETDDLPF